MIANLLPTLAIGAPLIGDEPDRDLPEHRRPAYEVPPNARDPFFPPPRTEAETVDAQVEQERVTRDAVRQAVTVTAIMGAQSGHGRAMINGRIYGVGDAFDLDIRGRTVQVTLLRITVRPDMVVLAFDDQEVTVPLMNDANGE